MSTDANEVPSNQLESEDPESNIRRAGFAGTAMISLACSRSARLIKTTKLPLVVLQRALVAKGDIVSSYCCLVIFALLASANQISITRFLLR